MMKIDKSIAEYWMGKCKEQQSVIDQLSAENEKLRSDLASIERERDFWQTRSVSN